MFFGVLTRAHAWSDDWFDPLPSVVLCVEPKLVPDLSRFLELSLEQSRKSGGTCESHF